MAQHSHKCLHCNRPWKCIDNLCPFHEDAELGEEVIVACSICRNKGKTFLEPKTSGEPASPRLGAETVPTKPTQEALDKTTETLNAINSRLGFSFDDKNSIDKIEPQTWVNIYHEYRVVYQNLKKIGELLHERKIVVRLETERSYQHKQKEKKKAASARVGGAAKKTPEEKQIAHLMKSFGMSEEEATKIVQTAIAQGKG